MSIQLAQFVTRKHAESQLLKEKEAAEAASRAQSDYLANLNREIRNALNGIIGMTEVAIATDLNPHQRDDLHFVLESANSLLKIVDDVPDFLKIGERQQPRLYAARIERGSEGAERGLRMQWFRTSPPDSH